jgi:hypothetical protein
MKPLVPGKTALKHFHATSAQVSFVADASSPSSP